MTEKNEDCCPTCFRLWPDKHALRIKEGMAKSSRKPGRERALTDKQCEAIRHDYRTTQLSITGIARKHGTYRSMVQRLVKDLPRPERPPKEEPLKIPRSLSKRRGLSSTLATYEKILAGEKRAALRKMQKEDPTGYTTVSEFI